MEAPWVEKPKGLNPVRCPDCNAWVHKGSLTKHRERTTCKAIQRATWLYAQDYVPTSANRYAPVQGLQRKYIVVPTRGRAFKSAGLTPLEGPNVLWTKSGARASRSVSWTNWWPEWAVLVYEISWREGICVFQDMVEELVKARDDLDYRDHRTTLALLIREAK